MATYALRILNFLIFNLLLSATLMAATIRGQITDSKTGETLIGVNVFIEGTSTGTATDLDGYYSIEDLEPGTYNLVISYVSYTTQTIIDITLGESETKVINVQLSELTTELTTVVIEGRKVDNNAVAILTLQKKSINVQDGISAQEIARFGSSDAGESMKKVTGASIVDGKYIFVRGLGDRYTNTQLNGLNLPSSDPYRNSTQLDIIPANMLDNIITSKTFSPDQPGSFTGGNVNITTKSFPDQFTLNATATLGYNDQSSLRDDFLGMERGSLDWLGYDDGGRDLPEILADPEVRPNFTTSFYVPARSNDSLAAILDEGSKSVSDNMTPLQTSSPLNHGLAFSVGNQVKLAGRSLGFFAGINYKRDYTMYTEGVSNQWQLIEYDGVGLNSNFNLTDQMATENPNLGGILNLAYKLSSNHEIGGNILYNHDAAITARSQSGKYPSVVSNSDAIFETRSLLFRERSLQSYQLNGKHLITSLKNTRIEWATGKVSTSQLEPDLRFFANTVVGDSAWFINPSEYPQPYHFWRYLFDDQYNAKLDISIPFLVERSNSNKIQFGALYSNKTRSFEEDRWQIFAKDGEAYQGDPDAYFGPDNTGVIGIDDITGNNIIGNYISDRSVTANSYSGTEIITAAYGMVIYQLAPKWKFVGGARMEWTDIEVISADSTKPIGGIEASDLLPSLNIIYALNDNSNIRGSFTQTIARPNLRELAPFFSFEFIGGETFLGNPDLERTNITNYDLRWEVFPKPGEMIAVSAYYKSFINPIIKVYNPTAINPEIEFKNVAEALVYGLEFEIRKSLSFISPSLTNFNVGTNLSIIQSRVDLDSAELAANQTLNPTFSSTRPFQGQSPYIVNANVNYTNLEAGIDITAAFNVFGPRLSEVSQAGTPDIYEQPMPTLDLFIKKDIKEHFSVRIGARNLLDARFRKTIEYKDAEYTVQEYTVGRTFTASVSYNIK